jgi:hypothetical protein
LHDYITAELAQLLDDPRFADGVYGALPSDAASKARAETVVMPRLRALLP